jgi:hypothetical protein
MRHRQTKGPETDRSDLTNRATSRLYLQLTAQGFVSLKRPYSSTRAVRARTAELTKQNRARRKTLQPQNNPQSKSDTKRPGLIRRSLKVCENVGMPRGGSLPGTAQEQCFPAETNFAGQVEAIFNEFLSERA